MISGQPTLLFTFRILNASQLSFFLGQLQLCAFGADHWHNVIRRHKHKCFTIDLLFCNHATYIHVGQHNACTRNLYTLYIIVNYFANLETSGSLYHWSCFVSATLRTLPHSFLRNVPYCSGERAGDRDTENENSSGEIQRENDENSRYKGALRQPTGVEGSQVAQWRKGEMWEIQRENYENSRYKGALRQPTGVEESQVAQWRNGRCRKSRGGIKQWDAYQESPTVRFVNREITDHSCNLWKYE